MLFQLPRLPFFSLHSSYTILNIHWLLQIKNGSKFSRIDKYLSYNQNTRHFDSFFYFLSHLLSLWHWFDKIKTSDFKWQVCVLNVYIYIYLYSTSECWNFIIGWYLPVNSMAILSNSSRKLPSFFKLPKRPLSKGRKIFSVSENRKKQTYRVGYSLNAIFCLYHSTSFNLYLNIFPF